MNVRILICDFKVTDAAVTLIQKGTKSNQHHGAKARTLMNVDATSQREYKEFQVTYYIEELMTKLELMPHKEPLQLLQFPFRYIQSHTHTSSTSYTSFECLPSHTGRLYWCLGHRKAGTLRCWGPSHVHSRAPPCFAGTKSTLLKQPANISSTDCR